METGRRKRGSRFPAHPSAAAAAAISGAGQSACICMLVPVLATAWSADVGANLTPSEQPRGTEVWGQVAAAQLVSTVSVPGNPDAWIGGHTSRWTWALQACAQV